MKKFLLSAVGALALASGAASAADLPRKSAPPPVVAVPMFTWTGFYVGLNAGYGFGETRHQGAPILPGNWNAAFAATLPPTLTGKLKPDGFVGGIQAGFNYQFNALVAGIEADAQFHDQRASGSAVNNFFGAAAPALFSNSTRIEWSASIRGRLGVAFDRVLLYATGGVAFASVKYSSVLDFTRIDGPNSVHTLGLSSTRTGYVVGGGIEYAVTNNIVLGAEYLYFDYGSVSGTTLNPRFAAPQQTQQSAKFTNNVVRARLSYKF